MEKFVESIRRHLQSICREHFTNVELKKPLTETEVQSFNDQTNCYVCDKALGNDKIMSYCHLSGNFRGAVHFECDQTFRIPYHIPIFFHNISENDLHLVIKEMWRTKRDKTKLESISVTSKDYTTVSSKLVVKDGNNVNICHIELRFLDSYRFLPNSLHYLVKNLKKEDYVETTRNLDCLMLMRF